MAQAEQTIILRYRDLITDTIEAHTALIASRGYVWWGWWRKQSEPRRLEELSQVSQRARQGSMRIGLYDKSRQVFSTADVGDCRFASTVHPIPSPEPEATPAYYREERLPAWFQLTAIRSVSREDFIRMFGAVPVGDDTLFDTGGMLSGTHTQTGPIAPAVSRLHGSTILHLTDVHFGTDFGFSAKPRPGQVPLPDVLSRDLRDLDNPEIGLLVVSGDLTTRGDSTHLFNTALPFLEDLCRRLSLPPENVVIVPGNHDIAYQEFALTYDHERAYNTFLQQFYGVPTQQHRLLRYELPNGRPLEVLTISSVKLRTQDTSNYGWVDWQACESILRATPAPVPNTLRIAVLHHHLASALRDERLPDPKYPNGSVSVTLNAGEIIEGLQRYGFSLVLHGHQHTPGMYRVGRGSLRPGSFALHHLDDPLYALAGGSAGARADRIDGDVRDNSYALVRINLDSVAVSARAYNPSGTRRDLFSADLRI